MDRLLTKIILVLPHEKLYLDQLPSADMYEKSYMHRDTLSYVEVTK
jgi:peptidylprolyl isomerase domain and WD repeat-containing protein 1